ncbi:MAG: creatininase family protein [Bacillota bacterium]
MTTEELKAGLEEEYLTLERLSWPELRDHMAAGTDLVLIPVGSTEQHGPNGSFSVDTGRAQGFVNRLAARMYPRALAIPAVPYTISPHHMNFPGTVTLTPETFLAVMREIVDSLYRHGFRKFFFANGHGGNRPALTLLMGQLREDYPDVKAAWASFTSVASDVVNAGVQSETHGHSCEGEMSQAMYLAPWTVKEHRVPGDIVLKSPDDALRGSISRALKFDEITANGALGDASKASWDFGREIIETALDRVEEYLEDF